MENIPNTPDVVFLARDRREVLLLEIGCVYDLYMDIAFNDKIMICTSPFWQN